MTTVRIGPQPAGSPDVRAVNLAVVLRQIRASAPCSRADIAAATGLNKATVSSLVGELIGRRMLRETGLVEHRIGRPATMIVIDGSNSAAVGVAVDADHLTVKAVDLAGDEVLSWRRAFPGLSVTPSRAFASILSLTRKAVTRVQDDGRQVLGLTVGVPGLVDTDGVVTAAPHLEWRDVDLRAFLVRGLDQPHFPLLVENGATLVALAEYRFGSHAGTAHLVALSGAVDVGAGIIAEGRPLRGAAGYAGEIAHLQTEPDGPPCPCGQRGCLDAVAGVPALIRQLDPRQDRARRVTDFEPEVARIVERARSGDEATLRTLERAGTSLGRAVSVLANLLNPEVVVLGGYYVPLTPWLLTAARAELRSCSVGPPSELVASRLGHGAAAVGGSASILDLVDAGQFPNRIR
ncbi:MAG TPA: ROK family transcriptional regulator [Micromonosporaceae bacterium]|nr:ROK family transcriptional regulator [Micromonosporaceae bacterium]